MARRRYISTDISTDTRVNRLAVEYGDFAALLYTWMVPHAGDDATITGDPETLLLVVCPGRREKTIEDVATALAGMDALGLVEWDTPAGVVRFPVSAFYKHQSYITESRRKTPPRAAPPSETAPNAADQRRTPQNASSFSFSSSVKSSSSAAPLPPTEPPPPPPESDRTYVRTIGGHLPTVAAQFAGIHAQLGDAWLAQTLGEIEADVGPLPRDRLGKGLSLAADQIGRKVAAGKIDSPRGFARKVIRDYLQEQRDGIPTPPGGNGVRAGPPVP